ncbi:MAG: hypothetical protein HOJ48_01020, partial [Desulfobacula sp.]|nr:hypothetical protein [Desulfobacula sp.]
MVRKLFQRGLCLTLSIAFLGMLLNPNLVYATSKGKIVVGSKTFTEQFILARISKIALENDGYEVDEVKNILSSNIRKELMNKKIDLYWEYTGTAYSAIFKQKDLSIQGNAEKLYKEVKRIDLEKNGIVWFSRSPANNTYALAMKKDLAVKYNLTSLSELPALLNKKEELYFSSNDTFYNRPDGFKALQKFYGFKVPRSKIKFIANSGSGRALTRGQVQVGLIFGTNWQIKHHDLLVLKDDRNFFPVYSPAPITRKDVVTRYPGLKEIFSKITPLLENETLIRLNY